MCLKVPVNNIVYWGMLGLLFFHRKLADLELLAAVRPDVDRMWAAQGKIENLFREWNVLEHDSWVRGFAGPKRFPAWGERQRDLVAGFDDEQLVAKLKANADLMEGIAVLLFTRAARNLGDAAPGEDVKINPYAIGLDPARWEADGLFDGTGMTPAEARQTPAGGIERMFVEESPHAIRRGRRRRPRSPRRRCRAPNGPQPLRDTAVRTAGSLRRTPR